MTKNISIKINNVSKKQTLPIGLTKTRLVIVLNKNKGQWGEIEQYIASNCKLLIEKNSFSEIFIKTSINWNQGSLLQLYDFISLIFHQ